MQTASVQFLNKHIAFAYKTQKQHSAQVMRYNKQNQQHQIQN